MNLEEIKDKIKGLDTREKFIVSFALVCIFVFVPYYFLYASSEKNLKSIKMESKNIKTEIDSINAAIASTPLQQVFGAETVTLPDTEDLAGMLGAITREANLANVEFISLMPEGISTNKDNYVQMKIKIELKVRFRALYDFLKNIETRQRLFLIKEIKFETNDTVYPSGIALIKAVIYFRKK